MYTVCSVFYFVHTSHLSIFYRKVTQKKRINPLAGILPIYTVSLYGDDDQGLFCSSYSLCFCLCFVFFNIMEQCKHPVKHTHNSISHVLETRDLRPSTFNLWIVYRDKTCYRTPIDCHSINRKDARSQCHIMIYLCVCNILPGSIFFLQRYILRLSVLFVIFRHSNAVFRFEKVNQNWCVV